MEQTIAFVLGVFAVLALAGVLNTFKTRVQIKDLYEEIEDLQKVINDLEREIHRDSEMLDRRIDQEIDRIDSVSHTLHDYADTLNNNTHDEMNKLHAYIDSRTDKMEERMKDNVAQLISDIYSNMEAKFNDNTAFVDNMFHEINSIKERVLSK